MKYKALRDSFDHNRNPKYCYANAEYEFDSDPGQHFSASAVEEKPKEPTKEELLARAEALGLDIDKRRSAANIKKAIEETESGDE